MKATPWQVRRWKVAFVQTVAVGVVFCLLRPAARALAASVPRADVVWSWPVLTGLTLALALCLRQPPLLRDLPRHARKLRNAIKVVPWWLPIAAAVVAVKVGEWCAAHWVEIASALADVPWPWLAGAGVAAVVATVAPFVLRRFRTRAQPTGPAQTVVAAADLGGVQPSQPTTFADLQHWLATDDAIKTRADDFLDHRAVVERIVARISASADGNKPPSIALVGPLGSGKSSIAGLVEERLRARADEPLFVRLSLWGYDTAQAAVRGLMTAVTREVGTHAPHGVLRTFADEYLDVIEGAGGKWFRPASAILGWQRPPTEVVAELGEVLSALGLRLIVWVEDVERFAGDARGGTEAWTLDNAKLAPVRALLHALDQTTTVTVVIADTALRAAIDADKLARFVEFVPVLQPRIAGTLIAVLRSACMGGFPRAVIDAADGKSALRQPQYHPSHQVIVDTMLEMRDAPSLLNAIVLVCAVPRTLKQVLRLALERWTAIPGEVYFDEVLVVSALQVCRPALFDFMRNHLFSLRGGLRRPPKPRGEAPPATPASLDWERVLAAEASAKVREAVETLVTFLFPNAVGASASPTAPQGLGLTRFDDRWELCLSPEARPPERTDQGALAALDAWNAGANADVVAWLVDDARSPRIVLFAQRLRRDRFGALLLAVARAEHPMVRPLDMVDVGVRAVALLARRGDPPPQVEIRDAVEQAIAEALPDAPAVAASLVMHFCQPGGAIIDDEPTRQALATHVLSLVEGALGRATPASLATHWSGIEPERLRILTVATTLMHQPQVDDPLRRTWRAVAARLLELMTVEPQVFAPLVASYVTVPAQRSMGDDPPTIIYDVVVETGQIAFFFGEDALAAAARPLRIDAGWPSPIHESVTRMVEWARRHEGERGAAGAVGA